VPQIPTIAASAAAPSITDLADAARVGQWLHARHRLLGGARPIEALAEGRVEDVRLAAQGFVDGSYVWCGRRRLGHRSRGGSATGFGIRVRRADR
jgi:hypothetical protein